MIYSDDIEVNTLIQDSWYQISSKEIERLLFLIEFHEFKFTNKEFVILSKHLIERMGNIDAYPSKQCPNRKEPD